MLSCPALRNMPDSEIKSWPEGLGNRQLFRITGERPSWFGFFSLVDTQVLGTDKQPKPVHMLRQSTFVWTPLNARITHRAFFSIARCFALAEHSEHMSASKLLVKHGAFTYMNSTYIDIYIYMYGYIYIYI